VARFVIALFAFALLSAGLGLLIAEIRAGDQDD